MKHHGGVTTIDWNGLDPSTYEQMVAVLLNNLHPEAKHIDGSGGDGGVDVSFELADGLHIYELKSFATRLTQTRRRQIKRSLETAARRSPKSWFLVLPLDFTPEELTWFDGLKAEVAFPIDWFGKTWLDSQFAAHRYIQEYFLEGASERVLDLVIQLREEEAALAGGVPDAIDRAERLVARVNELDPYYVFGIQVGPEGSTVTMRPRYVGAEQDRPITVSLQLRFDDTEEGRKSQAAFEEAIHFGVPVELRDEVLAKVEIDAPAGLDGSHSGGVIQLGTAGGAEPWSRDARLLVRDPDGNTQAQIGIRLTERSGGTSGVIVGGADRTGALTIRLRVDSLARQLTFDFSVRMPHDAYPADLLPTMHFMQALRPPNHVVLVDAETGVEAGGATLQEWEPLIKGPEVEFVQALADIQQHTHIYFTLPVELTNDEMVAVVRAARILRGERVVMQWNSVTINVSDDGKKVLSELLDKDDRVVLLERGEQSIEIAGHELPLGLVQTHIPSARPKDLVLARELLDSTAPEVQIEFVPADNTDMTVSR